LAVKRRSRRERYGWPHRKRAAEAGFGLGSNNAASLPRLEKSPLRRKNAAGGAGRR